MIKPTQLAIEFLDGTKETVEAFIVGDLALHRSRIKDWTITHVPTLMSFKSVTPKAVLKSKDKAISWMTKVQEGLKKDWLAMRKFTRSEMLTDEGKEHTKVVRGRIREHCLKII